MNILVTGAAGFVGRNLVENLKNIRDGKNRTRPALSVGEIYEYDLCNTPEQLDDWCGKADFVFNLAGVNRPKDPAEFKAGNFGFASTLLDTLKRHGNKCPVMLSSSLQATLAGRFGTSEYGLSKRDGEELFFRGAVYGVLSRYSQSMAVFVSALVFGLAHRNPPQVINAFVMGIFLAVAYAGTGSVAACVFIHALNNAFSGIVQYSQGYRLYYLLVPAIGLFVLALGAFTAVRIVMAAFRRRRAVAVFDDEATDVPRIGRRAYAAAFYRNPFVWIFAALIAAGVWVLYI